ncbi:MAG: NfeD family protein [Proteobacteria bacterium]|nr:NfeD family protein [Pseudomonadota bacterium]
MFDDFFNWVQQLDFWGWWILGLVLIILEVFAPSTIFLWLGIAAGIVGVVAFFLPDLSWQWEWTIFAFVAIISIIASRQFFRKNPGVEDNLTLNKRGAQYVGRQFTLVEPIRNGRGKIRVDDTQWAVEGPDMEEGDTVVVTGTDGSLLVVEPKAEG